MHFATSLSRYVSREGIFVFWLQCDLSLLFVFVSLVQLIPRIVEGNFVVKKAVGSKPAILGKKLKQIYIRTERFCEVIVDIDSDSVARKITKLSLGYVSSYVCLIDSPKPVFAHSISSLILPTKGEDNACGYGVCLGGKGKCALA